MHKEEEVTTLTLFYLSNNKFWAFQQMGLIGQNLGAVEGLKFFKLLGTGGGAGFSLRPDFTTYAFLGVWQKEQDAESFFVEHPFFRNYIKRATHYRTFYLRPLHAHGLWSGQQPFSVTTDKKNAVSPIAIITRATLRWQKLLSFWKAVPFASKAIENAKGVQFYKGIGEWPFVQQATFSIWEDFEAVKDFAYKGKSHAEIIKQTRKNNWYKEDLFSRFEILKDTGKRKTK